MSYEPPFCIEGSFSLFCNLNIAILFIVSSVNHSNLALGYYQLLVIKRLTTVIKKTNYLFAGYFTVLLVDLSVVVFYKVNGRL